MPGFRLRQLASVLILPFNVLLVIPSLLFLRCRGKRAGRLAPTIAPAAALPFTRGLGGLLVLTGPRGRTGQRAEGEDPHQIRRTENESREHG